MSMDAHAIIPSVRCLFQIVLFFAFATTSAQSSLESFQKEAEKALGSAVRIVDTDEMGANLGETFCNENPVLVKIRSGLNEALRQKVLAHELAHALICGEGILNRSISLPPFDGVLAIVPAVGAEIGSCFIDPLADAMAEQRGFSGAEVVDEFIRRSTGHTQKEVKAFFDKFGDWADLFSALTIYCADLRPHSLKISSLEEQIADRPSAVNRLNELRHSLGKTSCDDSQSCFILTKRLRDALAMNRYVIIINPSTGLFE